MTAKYPPTIKKFSLFYQIFHIRGIPYISYTSRGMGGGGQHKCIQLRTSGEGGSEHDQNYAFCMQVY